MKNPYPFKLSIVFIILSITFSCQNIDKEIGILNENFDSNTRGWIQEDTDIHKLEIKDGYYFIQNKDSTSDRTSSRSLDKAFLYSLPNTYSITTSIEIIESGLDTAFCGIIMESPSLEYEFRFYETGKVSVKEYNYQTKKLDPFDNIKSIISDENIKKFDVEINLNGWFFELYVSGEKLGSGIMSAKSWDRLTPFTGKSTSIGVDYLHIN